MNTRKIVAMISILILLVSGCSVIPQKEAVEEPNIAYADPLKYQSEFQNHLQYQCLNKDEQHAYGLLYTQVKDAIDADSVIDDEHGDPIPGVSIPFDVTLTKSSMSRLYESFLKDNPQFFFLSRTYRLEGREENGQVVYDTLLLEFTLDREERQEAILTLDRKVDEILAECPNTTDQYVIEQYLHDYLIIHCAYDDEAADSDSNSYANAYSAYGALIDGRAVCEGYAKAMQLLLHKVSIPATVVMGYAADDGESHMWNLVTINGHDYYLDVTWDDNDTTPHYTYFNMTTEAMLRTHYPDKHLLTNVECTVTEDNYFVRNNTYCDTSDRETIAETIAHRIQAGDTIIHLQFAPGKYENALLFLKNTQLTQKTVNNQLGYRITMWDYTLTTQPKQHVITLNRMN